MAARHGTRSKYNAGCRCDDCVQCNRDYDKSRRIAGRRNPTVTSLPLPPKSAPGEVGAVQAGVLAEIGGLSTAADRKGLVEIALALAKVLDSPLAIAQHPSAAHRLSETLDKLRKGADGRSGRLAAVRQMTRREATG